MTPHTPAPTSLPDLPLTCLETAEFTSTIDAVQGKNTVVDFWTTKCTRCPAALDKLDRMAQEPRYRNVQFISICCDKLDGAREIIERDDALRWNHVHHYYMEPHDKEWAKQVLGFSSVPFYVVLNEKGEITQKGNSKAVDLERVPGMMMAAVVSPDKENVKGQKEEESSVIMKGGVPQTAMPVTPDVERVFVIDDDF